MAETSDGERDGWLRATTWYATLATLVQRHEAGELSDAEFTREKHDLIVGARHGAGSRPLLIVTTWPSADDARAVASRIAALAAAARSTLSLAVLLRDASGALRRLDDPRQDDPLAALLAADARRCPFAGDARALLERMRPGRPALVALLEDGGPGPLIAELRDALTLTVIARNDR